MSETEKITAPMLLLYTDYTKRMTCRSGGVG